MITMLTPAKAGIIDLAVAMPRTPATRRNLPPRDVQHPPTPEPPLAFGRRVGGIAHGRNTSTPPENERNNLCTNTFEHCRMRNLDEL
jgi:hypothetical protein